MAPNKSRSYEVRNDAQADIGVYLQSCEDFLIYNIVFCFISWTLQIIYSPKDVQLICLSATIANPEELAGWITRVRIDLSSLYWPGTKPCVTILFFVEGCWDVMKSPKLWRVLAVCFWFAVQSHPCLLQILHLILTWKLANRCIEF